MPASDPTSTQPLTSEQRDRVQEHVGLVAVHLKRNVPDLGLPRREREWEDLFQEGCLGLIQAAQRYPADSSIPFPAYALSRIHNAVSTALRRRFRLLAGPERRDPRARPGHEPDIDDESLPRVVPLDHDPQTRAAAGRHHPDDLGRETIGDRIRDKYARTVSRAAESLSRGRSPRRDRRQLVDALREQRWLVPREDLRLPLRELARQLDCSYARVAETDHKLRAAIQQQLERDPEMRVLRARTGSGSADVGHTLDDRLEDDLYRAGAESLLDALDHLDVEAQAELLAGLFLKAFPDASQRRTAILQAFRNLGPIDREELLAGLTATV